MNRVGLWRGEYLVCVRRREEGFLFDFLLSCPKSPLTMKGVAERKANDLKREGGEQVVFRERVSSAMIWQLPPSQICLYIQLPNLLPVWGHGGFILWFPLYRSGTLLLGFLFSQIVQIALLHGCLVTWPSLNHLKPTHLRGLPGLSFLLLLNSE